ncbi:hypothetical protein JCM13304A_11660 [Desulfothermus okinawensis JCM 13304]
MVKIKIGDIEKNLLQAPDKTRKKSPNEFDEFLKKEISQDQEKIPTTPISTEKIQFQELEAALRLKQNQGLSIVMDKIESSLDKWEKYSQDLSAGNLRDSENTLNSILDQLSHIENKLNEGEIDPKEEVTDIVNELKIMALSEKARLSRGDYV